MKIANEEVVQDLLMAEYNAARVATSKHLLYLRDLAAQCQDVVELGIKRGVSSLALAWCQGLLHSYDIKIIPRAKRLRPILGKKWRIRQTDTRKVRPEDVPEHDLLFVDTLHQYHQVVRELDIFAPKTKKWIVFHDTITFATKGADGESGQYVPQLSDRSAFCPNAHGIRLAIDEFMISHPKWVIHRHVGYGHGLLTLRNVL